MLQVAFRANDSSTGCIASSDDTVLRRVRCKPVPEVALHAVRNLGVDDWAWRKGQEYGTFLVNLDLRRVVDLLPDRAAESFSEWLRQHPDIVTISRDRCGIYPEGASLGASQSQQIADRFHLVLNLSAAMERVLEQPSRQLTFPPAEDPTDASQKDGIDSDSDIQPPAPAQSQLRRQRLLERYEQVVAMFQSGHSQAAISRTPANQRKTIRRWLRRGEFPERKPPHRPMPKVNAFGAYLQQPWNEGCHNATRLYQEIRERVDGRALRGRLEEDGRAARPEVAQRISPKRATILVARAADRMTDEQQLLNRITDQCPELGDLRRLALAFRAALAADTSTQLRQWIEGAKRSEFGHVVRFGYSLQKDNSAVAAAVDTSWSTGQMEGQINRLKTIKRQMYSRAGFELLRARVMPYSVPAATRAADP